MGTDAESTTLAVDRSLRWRRFKGRVFEGVLVGATLFGVASLVVIFLLIAWDAIGPAAAEPAWYLVYFGTLVGPVSAHLLYVRRRPVLSRINARSYAIVTGALALTLTVYVVIDAVSPYDVFLPVVFATVPPLAVLAHARRYGESHLTGPAVPVSILGGVILAVLVHPMARPTIGIMAQWVAYFVVVSMPAAGLLGLVAHRRTESLRAGAGTAVVVLLATLVAAVIGIATGTNASLWVVLTSAFVAPVAVFAVDTLRRRPEAWFAILGPAVLVGGILLGAWIEGQYGIAGVDTWITPTLLLESWSDFRPEQAGIYPQLVGSIIIVSIMAILSFPVGIGGAIYLEEYAPNTGWGGRLASALDVNISNLAGVPSVVYGLLGLAMFRQLFGLSPGIALAAGATLGLLILPIVIVSSQEALRAVPDEVRQASYGMGASRWQTVRNVVLPNALPGMLTGTILALGRAIGETAPLVMIGVATTRFSPPEGLFSGATALPLQIFAARGHNMPEYRNGVVAATALVLLVLMLVMNGAAILIRNKYQNQ